jgi:uncharacterized protein with HEPN domain
MKTSKVSLEVALKEMDFIVEKIMPLSEPMFNDDPFAQRASILSLIIIGEELAKVNKKVKEKYINIPWSLVKGMRNKWFTIMMELIPTLSGKPSPTKFLN